MTDKTQAGCGAIAVMQLSKMLPRGVKPRFEPITEDHIDLLAMQCAVIEWERDARAIDRLLEVSEMLGMDDQALDAQLEKKAADLRSRAASTKNFINQAKAQQLLAVAGITLMEGN